MNGNQDVFIEFQTLEEAQVSLLVLCIRFYRKIIYQCNIYFNVLVEVSTRNKDNHSKLAMLLHTSSTKSIAHNAHDEIWMFNFEFQM